MAEPRTTLWIRMTSGQCEGEVFPLYWDDWAKKRWPTFEIFYQNFIRGWGDGPVDHVVQDDPPSAETKWLRVKK